MKTVVRIRFAQAVLLGTENQLGLTAKQADIRFDEDTGVVYYRAKGAKQVGFTSIGNIAYGLFAEGERMDVFALREKAAERAAPSSPEPAGAATLNQAMRRPNPDRVPLVPAALKPPKAAKSPKAA